MIDDKIAMLTSDSPIYNQDYRQKQRMPKDERIMQGIKIALMLLALGLAVWWGREVLGLLTLILNK